MRIISHAETQQGGLNIYAGSNYRKRGLSRAHGKVTQNLHNNFGKFMRADDCNLSHCTIVTFTSKYLVTECSILYKKEEKNTKKTHIVAGLLSLKEKTPPFNTLKK